MNPVAIAHHIIGPGQRTFVIAEIGCNHNGDTLIAKQLIDVAKRAGCDAVKFQTFKSELLVTQNAPKAQYQLESTSTAESQFDMLKSLELSADAHRELQDYCNRVGILFLSSAFDRTSVDLLNSLDLPCFKLGSGEITDLPLLTYVAASGKPLIISTGMSSLSEVEEALTTIYAAGCRQLVLLHCVSSYPAIAAEANLRAMETMSSAFDVPVGYSDHTCGIEVALAAVALGACVIEKHITLDCSMPGPDHAASIEPDDLSRLVSSIRKVEECLGNGIKLPTPSEINVALVARKSLVAASKIPAGTILTNELIAVKRPGTGLRPAQLSLIVGRTAKMDIEAESLLTMEMLS